MTEVTKVTQVPERLPAPGCVSLLDRSAESCALWRERGFPATPFFFFILR